MIPSKKENYNRLIHEKSPYLLQHKENPIWWHPWGPEAFKKAQTENKPVFLSVGYSTCHWCHVMEGDSFEKEEVAEILNKHFIAIKVDREERPDVDSLYMTATQMLTGRGGWPMSVIMTPDRQPFWAGTFVPREQFMQLLTQVSKLWNSPEKSKILESSQKITAQLLQVTKQEQVPGTELPTQSLQSFFKQSQKNFDPKKGGFGTAPKFPPSMNIMALLRIYRRSQNTAALEMATKTLDAMARGGLHDHLGGGFHRYSTDADWFVPHFEKMLYDNALITLAYLEAWQINKNPEYAFTAKHTLNYILRDMQHKDGGFYSAEDADSEKAEGKFYIWQQDELKSLLNPEEYNSVKSTYHTEAQGNFEISKGIAEIEKAAGLKEVHQANILALHADQGLINDNSVLMAALEKMFAHRKKRIRPGLDDKILTSWNGLMIAAMSRAARVLNKKSYKEAAIKAANFIEKNLRQQDGKLLHRYRDQDARFNGYLEDYAYLIFGYIELYHATFDQKWLVLAHQTQDRQNKLFYDDNLGGYFDTDGSDQTMLTRTKDYSDNATPSANSVSALNLLRLGDLTQNTKFRSMSQKLLRSTSQSINSYPTQHAFLLLALDYMTDRSKEIAIIYKDKADLDIFTAKLLNDGFLPNQIVAAFATDQGTPTDKINQWLSTKPLKDGKTTAYVCEQGSCQLPTNDAEEALRLASEHNTISL